MVSPIKGNVLYHPSHGFELSNICMRLEPVLRQVKNRNCVFFQKKERKKERGALGARAMIELVGWRLNLHKPLFCINLHSPPNPPNLRGVYAAPLQGGTRALSCAVRAGGSPPPQASRPRGPSPGLSFPQSLHGCRRKLAVCVRACGSGRHLTPPSPGGNPPLPRSTHPTNFSPAGDGARTLHRNRKRAGRPPGLPVPPAAAAATPGPRHVTEKRRGLLFAQPQ